MFVNDLTAVQVSAEMKRHPDTAIRTAVEDVESAGLNARVESVDSALVGLNDIAELTGMSRQAIALLKDGARG